MRFFFLLMLFLAAQVVNAHSGRTNADGCHNDNVGAQGITVMESLPL